MTSPLLQSDQQRFKREDTVAYGGLVTPNESMSTAGTASPKRESIDQVSLEVSDTAEGISLFPISHHGLMVETEQDEGYQTQVPDRKARSQSRKPPELYLVCYG